MAYRANLPPMNLEKTRPKDALDSPHRRKRQRLNDPTRARVPENGAASHQGEPQPLWTAFDLGSLFKSERDRVDRQLDTIRAQIALLDTDRANAPPSTAAAETTNRLPAGHPLESFISDCLDVSGAWAEAGCGAVSQVYKKWCLAHLEHMPFNHITFAKTLTKHFPRRGCVNRVVYTGMALKRGAPSDVSSVGAEDSEDIGSEDSDRSGTSEEYQRALP
jgi:hypothetical protein